jgi:hypothetical protein
MLVVLRNIRLPSPAYTHNMKAPCFFKTLVTTYQATQRHNPEDHNGKRLSVGRVDCCWSSPAPSFLVPSPAGLMTIFYCLTTLGVVQLIRPVQPSRSWFRAPWPYFCFFQTFTCFELGPPLRREERSLYNWSLPSAAEWLLALTHSTNLLGVRFVAHTRTE